MNQKKFSSSAFLGLSLLGADPTTGLTNSFDISSKDYAGTYFADGNLAFHEHADEYDSSLLKVAAANIEKKDERLALGSSGGGNGGSGDTNCACSVGSCDIGSSGGGGSINSNGSGEPDKEEWGTIVVRQGSGLKTGCTFRSGGPLAIEIPVPVMVNSKKLNSEEKLNDPDELIKSGVLSSRKVELSFPAWDIDNQENNCRQTDTDKPIFPEKNTIIFNGKAYENPAITGVNNNWRLQTFNLDIGDLIFSEAKTNVLQINIDTKNAGLGEYWCTAIDWVQIKLDVAPPRVLAHGINADKSTWDESDAPGVLSTLDQSGVLYERFSTDRVGTTLANGHDLSNQIGSFLNKIRSDRVHIIAHSKGGLDTQVMNIVAPFKVLSLSTLSTPHYGSVAADLSVLELESYSMININEDPNAWLEAYLNQTLWVNTFGLGPKRPGLYDLQTQAAINAIGLGSRLLGTIVPTYTIGASADLNNNEELDGEEAAGLSIGSAKIYRATWHVLRDYASARMVSRRTERVPIAAPSPDVPVVVYVPVTVLSFETETAPQPRNNDIVVTTFSANPSYGKKLGDVLGNHTTVKSGANIQTILDKTIQMR